MTTINAPFDGHHYKKKHALYICTVFKDRLYAGYLLAKRLEKFHKEDGVVLAVPRGGVPVAYQVAKRLGFPLEVVFTKKIGHPDNREFAIGAVSLEERILGDHCDVPANYIEEETSRLRHEIRGKQELYCGNRVPTSLKNKTIILTDDGIATGKTILLTIKLLRAQGPKTVILAVPVVPHDKVKEISKHVEELIYIIAPYDFKSVGCFYENFEPVSDEEIISLLNDIRKNRDNE
ncbi:MAG: phosphoribosyltransferase [Bacteroidia bacterium]